MEVMIGGGPDWGALASFLSTLVLGGIALWQIRQNRVDAREAKRPVIQVLECFLAFSVDEHSDELFVVVRNAGLGPALDVEIFVRVEEGESSPVRQRLWHDDDIRLSRIVEYLPAGERSTMLIYGAFRLVRHPRRAAVDIRYRGTYRDDYQLPWAAMLDIDNRI